MSTTYFRSARVVIATCLITLALLATLGLYLVTPNHSLQVADNGTARLVDLLQTDLRGNGYDIQTASAQGQSIQIIGPPNGTLYEPNERVVLRWTTNRPLKRGESFVVRIAYYQQKLALELEPTLKSYTTTSQLLVLPTGAMTISQMIPVITWNVVIAGQLPQPSSSIYRLLSVRTVPFQPFTSYGWWPRF